MAPEMARGDGAGLCIQSDIYLLGGLLLEIVTGSPPHRGATPLDAIQNAADNRLAITGDHYLMPVIRQCLELFPENRYASVKEMRTAITQRVQAEKCRTHMEAGRRLYNQALRNGDYALFQESLSEYDNALATCPDDRPAQYHRLQTVLAYSRTALANREFDLAGNLVKPEIATSTEAAVLAVAITREENQAVRRARRTRMVNIGLVALVPFILGAGTYVYIANRPGIDNLVDNVMNYDQRLRFSRSNGLYSGLLAELKTFETSLVTFQASHRRGVNRVEDDVAELMSVLARCNEEFRFPDGMDMARRDAACRFVLERQERIVELFTSAIGACESQCRHPPHPMLPDLKRQYARFIEFLEEYRTKGL
ncbi:MAG: hypothetical protein LIQ31_13735 [Planctomycetes bacterium]|nr:hypothetical protein [Planctomycetota bacterium]